jgi:tetratricopeptide (TPR) repeat protein
MRKTLFLSAVFVICNFLEAQKICSFSNANYNTFTCIKGYNPSFPSIQMTNTINEILNTSGLENSNFVVKSCSDVNNALAFIHDNERYILMDENFFNSFSKENLLYIMILAHEIGHHLHGHVSLTTENAEASRNDELEADQFAGFIIGKLGFNFSEVKSLATKIMSIQQSNSHPGLVSRLESYLKGYNSAIKQDEKTINLYYDEIKKQAVNSILMSNIIKTRNSYVEMLSDFSPSKLDKVIDSYLALKLISQDLPWVDGELAELYAYKNDYVNANILALNSYRKLSQYVDAYSFLILAWEFSKKGGFEMDALYLSKMENIDIVKISNPTILKYYARFLVERGQYEQAINTLDKALYYLSDNIMNQEGEILYSDILNDRAIINLRLGKSSLSEFDISKSVSIRNRLVNNGNIDVNMNFLIDVSNNETIYSNSVLILWRNGKYEECVTAGKQFLKDYLNSKYVNNGDIPFYIGVSLFELREYEESLEYLNFAISKTNKNGEMYLYRGMVNNKLGNYMKSCIDLTIACDMNEPIACNRLQLLCNE